MVLGPSWEACVLRHLGAQPTDQVLDRFDSDQGAAVSGPDLARAGFAELDGTFHDAGDIDLDTE